MVLPVPNLDDRTFQDIVNEARRRIPLYCPEWTDHNLSDPGITLIELFAWMTEMIIYRMNKVPDKNYVKFLELIGVELAPAASASTEVSFLLSASQPIAVTIPQGTEVSTVRTETEDAIEFTTLEDVRVEPADLQYLLISDDGSEFDDRLPVLRDWEGMVGMPGEQGRRINLFADAPFPGNAFYLGFGNSLQRAIMSVSLGCSERAAPGIVPTNPPLRWEYWNSETQDWAEFQRSRDAEAWLEEDGTRGLNAPGSVVLHLPGKAGPSVVGLREASWIRCVVVQGTAETGSYEASPQIGTASATNLGGVALAANTTSFEHEVLGTGDGSSGQIFTVGQLPALPLGPEETVEVELEDGSGWDLWEQVSDFAASSHEDKHFTFDAVSGEVRFGPVIRTPSGEERQYGAVPPAGMSIGLTSYRFGGGPNGNVGPDTLTALKSSIPYVASVTNRRVASGGVDPEGIEYAKMRGPQTLRTRNRAVTEEDFEHLAREASPSVVRARCIQPREVGTEGDPLPGVVRVLLVPTIPASSGRTVAPEDLRVPRELMDQVRSYLDERRLLTTMLIVSEPEYHWVSVEAVVRARQGADPERVRADVEDRLYEFIHPVSGGTDGNGWPFGRSVFASELYSQIQPVPGVEFIEEIRMFPVNPETGEPGEPTQTLTVPSTGVVCSYTHRVTCT
ncbi:MAG: putative baseplate assembly protein [Chloroflexi bacterium]|nr:putative baseplate assembly protein [Chloroflexota bacterium]